MERQFNATKRWSQVLAPFAARDVAILEVGSGFGGSATTFLRMLPHSRIVCVDVFTTMPKQEEQFESNLAPFAQRVEKMKARSFVALDALGQQGRQFEIVYIDGSHARDDALVDSLLAWRLLKDCGILIWDGYVWELGHLPSEQRPMEAIDIFLNMYAQQISVLEKGYQVIARKVPSEEPDSAGYSEGFVYPRTVRNLVRFLARRPLHRPRHGR